MTYGEAITAVLTQGGFDSTASNSSRQVVGSWVNAKVREMGRKSMYLKAERDIGPTVAAQAEYTLAADILEVMALRVGASKPWGRIGQSYLWEVRSGKQRVDTSENPGVFAPDYGATGAEKVELNPAPDTAGASIYAFVATWPTTLSDEATHALPFPDEFNEGCVDGAIGMGYDRIKERPDLAQGFEAKFVTKAEDLRKFTNKRLSSGPARIKVRF